jgi:mycofactocin biosynthesis protein MftB
VTIALERAYEVASQVAIRPEPFGALAYHYGNRRLVFLRRPEVVRLLQTLGDHATLADALHATGIDDRRWPSFIKALASLEESEIIRARQD